MDVHGRGYPGYVWIVAEILWVRKDRVRVGPSMGEGGGKRLCTVYRIPPGFHVA